MAQGDSKSAITDVLNGFSADAAVWLLAPPPEQAISARGRLNIME